MKKEKIVYFLDNLPIDAMKALGYVIGIPLIMGGLLLSNYVLIGIGCFLFVFPFFLAFLFQSWRVLI